MLRELFQVEAYVQDILRIDLYACVRMTRRFTGLIFLSDLDFLFVNVLSYIVTILSAQNFVESFAFSYPSCSLNKVSHGDPWQHKR